MVGCLLRANNSTWRLPPRDLEGMLALLEGHVEEMTQAIEVVDPPGQVIETTAGYRGDAVAGLGFRAQDPVEFPDTL